MIKRLSKQTRLSRRAWTGSCQQSSNRMVRPSPSTARVLRRPVRRSKTIVWLGDCAGLWRRRLPAKCPLIRNMWTIYWNSPSISSIPLVWSQLMQRRCLATPHASILAYAAEGRLIIGAGSPSKRRMIGGSRPGLTATFSLLHNFLMVPDPSPSVVPDNGEVSSSTDGRHGKTSTFFCKNF